MAEKLLYWAMGLLLLAILFAGCPRREGTCTSTQDCKAGETCTNGICQKGGADPEVGR